LFIIIAGREKSKIKNQLLQVSEVTVNGSLESKNHPFLSTLESLSE